MRKNKIQTLSANILSIITNRSLLFKKVAFTALALVLGLASATSLHAQSGAFISQLAVNYPQGYISGYTCGNNSSWSSLADTGWTDISTRTESWVLPANPKPGDIVGNVTITYQKATVSNITFTPANSEYCDQTQAGTNVHWYLNALGGLADPTYNSSLIEYDQPKTTNSGASVTVNLPCTDREKITAADGTTVQIVKTVDANGNVTAYNPTNTTYYATGSFLGYRATTNQSYTPYTYTDATASDRFLYPNHCLQLCVSVKCMPEVYEAATGTPTFPIQKVTFEIFKFLQQNNPLDENASPPIRTIEMYPSGISSSNKCYGFQACPTSEGVRDCSKKSLTVDSDFLSTPLGQARCGGNPSSPACISAAQNEQVMTFCTPWDGSYNFNSEFAKTNGTFGFRGHLEVNYQPDPQISDSPITIDQLAAFPGAQQMPIKIDLVNVHTVRSSATLVGNINKVSAEPYKIRYRLSKDAKVQMLVLDANGYKDTDELIPTNADGARNSFVTYGNNKCTSAKPYLLKTILDGTTTKLGEGSPDGGQVEGSDATVEEEAWDGRDEEGRLIPWGNYIVSVQGLATDRFGTDYSRFQHKQISLDPLQITDLAVQGLNKDSTAYASMAYMLTEPAKVYLDVYLPGTTFKTLYTPYDSANPLPVANYNPALPNRPAIAGPFLTGTTVDTNRLVYRTEVQQQGRTAQALKWDGRCWIDPSTHAGESACTTVGEPVPDGDYVYLLWAEIPYTDAKGLPSNYVRGDCVEFDAVRPYMYSTGILGVNRGNVDITIQPVGYSTLGSSPVAYGLDPFTFRYSLSREAIVTASIKTTDGKYTIKKLVDGEVQVSQQMNALSWDGIDQSGRYIGPGTYLFEVTAHDPLFPNDPGKAYTQTATFPVDIFRVVDVSDTPLLGDSYAEANISYTLSKAMTGNLYIYNKGVVIPNAKNNGNPTGAWPEVCSQTEVTNAFSTNTLNQLDCIYYSVFGGATHPVTRVSNLKDPSLDPLLQPIKSFTGTKPGEGAVRVTEKWDGLSFDSGVVSTIIDDGRYPYVIAARAEEPSTIYYKYVDDPSLTGNATTLNPLLYPNYMLASDRPTGYITVARGSIQFLDGSVTVSAKSPVLYHSSETIKIPEYTIGFKVNRVAEVDVDIVSTFNGACLGGPPGTICKRLTSSINAGNVFEGNIDQKITWDGKDEQGNYVMPGAYEVRLQANGYPFSGIPNTYETVITRVLNADLFQIFDVYVEDVKAANDNIGMIAYQTSVPMKVAIQILKPGTTMTFQTSGGFTTAVLMDPVTKLPVASDEDVLVKALVGVRAQGGSIEENWPGLDYAMQDVPDGIYPFRFVSAVRSGDIDSVTGAINNQQNVADWKAYTNFGYIIVAKGDSQFVCDDWEKTVIFYPNPLRVNEGKFEVTKTPVPGDLSIKIYNLAGDLVRTKGYSCYDDQNNGVVMNSSLSMSPDGNLQSSNPGGNFFTYAGGNIRNTALKCHWDKTNDHGKKVARGVYFGLVDFKATESGRQHCQKVVKILIP
ncbi:hypothetical protein Dip518_000435 [Parelusimicrobium proximum]|uniref:hypothetical protein n=1 Tax=Parelusimicrobium proximum TaxID=3228953 RepID=UPI003D176D97